MSDTLQTDFPELFEAARFLRERAVAAGGSSSDVRLRCITGADGTVIAGKAPPPDPESWATATIEAGSRPWDPQPLPESARSAGYRGRRR